MCIVTRVLRVVAAACHVTENQILEKRRTAAIVRARQVAAYVCREVSPFSYPELGAKLKRNHTTILHSVTRLKSKLDKDPALQSLINTIIDEVTNGDRTDERSAADRSAA